MTPTIQNMVVISNGDYVMKQDKVTFRSDDLNKAIMDIYDMTERTQINFIILGDLAKTIHDKKDQVFTDHLEFAIPKNAVVPEIHRLFTGTWLFKETKYGYTYDYVPPTHWDVHIPVEVHVIKGDYSFFKNPDHGFYRVDDFYIPNPFEEYWKVRGLVR